MLFILLGLKTKFAKLKSAALHKLIEKSIILLYAKDAALGSMIEFRDT